MTPGISARKGLNAFAIFCLKSFRSRFLPRPGPTRSLHPLRIPCPNWTTLGTFDTILAGFGLGRGAELERQLANLREQSSVEEGRVQLLSDTVALIGELRREQLATAEEQQQEYSGVVGELAAIVARHREINRLIEERFGADTAAFPTLPRDQPEQLRRYLAEIDSLNDQFERLIASQSEISAETFQEALPPELDVRFRLAVIDIDTNEVISKIGSTFNQGLRDIAEDSALNLDIRVPGISEAGVEIRNELENSRASARLLVQDAVQLQRTLAGLRVGDSVESIEGLVRGLERTRQIALEPIRLETELDELTPTLIRDRLEQAAGPPIPVDFDLDIRNLSADEIRRLLDDIEEINESFERQQRLARQVGQALSNGIQRAIVDAENFGDAMLNILRSIAAAAVDLFIVQPLLGSLFGQGGLFGGLIPGRQFGGPISPGQPYLVGEAGPELIVPNIASTVIPANALGAAPVNVSISVQSTDGPGVERALARALPAFLDAAATLQSQRTNRDRFEQG